MCSIEKLIRFGLTYVAVAGAALLCGCSADDGNCVELRRTHAHTLRQAYATPGEESAVNIAPADPSGILTRGDAIAAAFEHNPELQAISWEVRAADANRLQGSLRPNPEVEVEVEQFGRTGEMRDFGVAETTVQLGQEIELADKRGKCGYLAVLDAHRTLLEARTEYIDALTSYHKASADLDPLIGRPLSLGTDEE